MKLEDKLDKIKKKFTNKSSFLYSTYVWNFNKIIQREMIYTKKKSLNKHYYLMKFLKIMKM